MHLSPVEHFFPHYLAISGLISADPAKKWGKKCSTGQMFICTEVTSYKIHILVAQFAGILQDVMSWIDELTVYLQLKKNF